MAVYTAFYRGTEISVSVIICNSSADLPCIVTTLQAVLITAVIALANIRGWKMVFLLRTSLPCMSIFRALYMISMLNTEYWKKEQLLFDWNSAFRSKEEQFLVTRAATRASLHEESPPPLAVGACRSSCTRSWGKKNSIRSQKYRAKRFSDDGHASGDML